MRGSLAIWCDPVDEDVNGHSAKLELHFNIWMDLGSENVLDIGILFKEARPIRQLYLYFPAVLPLDQVKDLSPILQDSTTLSAVFNDTLSVGSETLSWFEAKKADQIAFRVVRLNGKQIIKRDSIVEKDGSEGTVLTFTEELFRAMHNVGDHYIRFRIPLRGDMSNLFITDFDPNDRIFLSAFYRTDVIEFRMNERRNFGEQLRSDFPVMKMPAISAIHYFLVRQIGTELVQSHADFRKMRRLEPRLWNSYLEALGRVHPERMVIYHWREGGGLGQNVEDFIAFTIFRTARDNLKFYLTGILLLGAGGNAFHEVVTDATKGQLNEEQLIVFAIVLSALICVYLALSRASIAAKLHRAAKRLSWLFGSRTI